MNIFAKFFALGILGIMFIVMLASSWNDSAIMDELPHIPAGYSYLTEKDYRLNPEHPPLIKILAAVPLLFQNINFPSWAKEWTEDINGQWDFGRIFLYQSKNNPDEIIFWARIPVMLLALLTGWILFSWTQKRFGSLAALLALTFFAFSPTIIAHSRFVTTDLGATFGFLIGIITFVRFLENPTLKNTILAGIAFGVAELLKFSLVLLIPIYVIILFFWLYARKKEDLFSALRTNTLLIKKNFLLIGVGFLLIWPVYQYTVWNYPPERQKHDTEFILTSFAGGPKSFSESCLSLKHLARCPAELVIYAADKPILRPYAEYALGVLMVFQRSAGGNTAYFLGDVSNIGSRWYFPVSYVLKEPLPILILEILALYFAFLRIWHPENHSRKKFFEWIQKHLTEFSTIITILVYWLFSIKSPLNIGLRHVLPTLPFFYILTSVQLSRWLSKPEFHPQSTWFLWFFALWKAFVKQMGRYFLVYTMLLWLFAETLFAFPGYLSYYNELAGGTGNGYKFIVDSNYDWGQDLKRLQKFVKENNIEKISLDYFGGGSPAYYLGNTFEPWWSARGPAHEWFAVSTTFLMGAQGNPVYGFNIKPEDSYRWLRQYRPVGRAGQSIFIYKLP